MPGRPFCLKQFISRRSSVFSRQHKPIRSDLDFADDRRLMTDDCFTLTALAVRIESKADVAQLVEQPIRNRQVSGSSPLVGSSLSTTCDQLAETCCTTAARAIFASSCFMASVTTWGTVLM